MKNRLEEGERKKIRDHILFPIIFFTTLLLFIIYNFQNNPLPEINIGARIPIIYMVILIIGGLAFLVADLISRILTILKKRF